MKLIRSVIDDLVQRRLWPVAVLLVAGIIAVPVLLGHKGASATASAATPAGAATASGATTDVALATSDTGTDDTPASGRGLSHLQRHDPFVPPAKETPKAVPGTTTAGQAASSGAGTGATSSSSPGGGGDSVPVGGGSSSSTPASGGGGVSTPPTDTTTTTTTTTTAPPAPTYAYTAVDVAFGHVSSGLTMRRDVGHGAVLPHPADPVVVYLGLQAHSRRAVFVVSADADPRGDARCHPRPSDCQTLLMRAGETEFLSVGHALYRLDVRAVRSARTTSKAHARAAARRIPVARTASAAGAARWVRSADRAAAAPDRPAPTDIP